MPLTLVLGPANSAKAGEVLGAYADAAHRGAVLVVPTALDAEYYERELAADGAILGSVLTFTGLASEIARRAGYEGRRLSKLQRARVLQRALEQVEFQVVGRSADGPGFAVAAGELIAELERSLVTPQRFAQALETWAREDPERFRYAHDVAAIYRAHIRETERVGRIDPELYAWRALDALRADAARWGTEPAFFYGFDDLTPLERDAIETLARVVGIEVTVSLTYEPGRAAFAARAEAVEELRTLAGRVVELTARDEYYESGARAALHHVERWLFEPAPQQIDPGPAIRLLEAGSERAEAELVAAEVLALLRAAVPGEEIVVVHRSLARAGAVIGRVFEEYGIPTTIARSIPLGHTPLGHGLLALARCALLDPDEASAEDLIDYLRTPGLLDHPQIADKLELDVRREALRTAAQARERLGWRLEEIDALRVASDPAAELAWQGRRLLAAPGRGEAAVLDAGQELDARALSATLRALADVEELGDKVAGTDLIELLEELRLDLGSRARPGAVIVGEPLAIRARRFRAVFVCGLQEGEFPAAGAPEPFLSDDRRWELASSAGLRLRPAEDALARERFLFYACISRATEQVFLSYRSSDEEGNLALPSPFIDDVGDLLVPGWADRRRKRLLADVVWPLDDAPTARELARAQAAATAPVAGDVGYSLGSLSEVALAHVRHREIVSGGALEAYGDCPVKWLVERQLDPVSFEPEADALARGTYMHRALEHVLRQLGGAVTPSTLADALRILDRFTATAPAPVAPDSRDGVRAAALRTIHADLVRYLDHEARNGIDWGPRELEFRFGFDEDSAPPLVLGEAPDDVRVRGAIDRVDVDAAGGRAIVRDYKSGRERPEHRGSRWSADRRLQVALYMLAVRNLLGLEPVAGLYQPLSGGALRPRGLFVKGAELGTGLFDTDGRDEEELRAELADAAARAVELAARLRTGELTPCPETCSRQGCSYPGICRS